MNRQPKTDMEQNVATRTSTNSLLKVAIIGGTAIAIVAAMFFLWPRTPAKPVNTNPIVQPTPKQIHAKFVELAKQYQLAPTARKESVKTALHGQAQKRQQAMFKLMKQDASAYLALALNQNDRELLPADIQTLVEADVELEGTLAVNHADNFETKTVTDQYVVTGATTTDQTLLYFAAEPDSKDRGATVKIKGSKILDAVAVPNTSDAVQVTAPANLASATTGAKRVVIILYNFASNPNQQPHTPTQVTQEMFTDTLSGKDFYAKTSADQLQLNGEVYGWYTINAAPTGCTQETWASLAGPMAPPAAQTGVDYYVFVNPFISGCGGGATGQYRYNGVSTAVINGWNLSVTLHELGHLFGVNHANGLNCYDQAGARVTISSNCISDEYGDPYTVMGTLIQNHFNNAHTVELGWYGPDNIQTITASGDYGLYPIEATTFGTDVRALRIASRTAMRSSLNPNAPPIVKDGYYYLEYRRPFAPYDAFYQTDRVVNGLSIRVSNGKTHLIDMTPETLTFTQPSNHYDLALLSGQTFTDPDRGLTVSVTLAPDKSMATAHVTLTCVSQRPTITINGDTWSYAKAGQAVERTLTIRNNDYPECGPAEFVITPNVPNAWTQTGPSTVTLEPGLETTVTVAIAPAATTTDGLYTISETVTNQAAPSATATSTSQTVVYDSTLPQVIIHAPTAGSLLPLTGNVIINTEVIDFGSYPKQGSIIIDGVQKKSCQFFQIALCQFSWPVDGIADGVHKIEVVGTDFAGNSTRATINVYYPSSGGEVTPGEIEG